MKMYIHLYKQKNQVLLDKIRAQTEVALTVCQRMLQDINDIIDQQKMPPIITQKEWDILSKDDLNV